jgi:hypothetical protein
MKKYKVYGQIASPEFTHIIEADNFHTSDRGYYYFFNSKTDEEWYFPISRSIVKIIK